MLFQLSGNYFTYQHLFHVIIALMLIDLHLQHICMEYSQFMSKLIIIHHVKLITDITVD